MAKPTRNTVDDLIAQWRAAGLDVDVGKPAALPEIVVQTKPQSLDGCFLGLASAAPSASVYTTHSTGVVVDVPPSSNNIFASWRCPKTGKIRRFASKPYKKWIKENGWKLAQLGKVQEYPIRVVLTVEGHLREGRDISNLEKGIVDTMKKVGVIIDDSWTYITNVTIRYRRTPDGEGVRVTIGKDVD